MIEVLNGIREYFLGHYTQWLFFIVIIIVGYIAIGMVNRYIAHFFSRVDFDQTLEVFIQKTIKILLWIILMIVILSNLGFNVTGLFIKRNMPAARLDKTSLVANPTIIPMAPKPATKPVTLKPRLLKITIIRIIQSNILIVFCINTSKV